MSRSHSVVEVEDCLTSIEGATQLAIKNSSRATRGEIEIVGHNTDDLVVVDKQGGPWVSEQVAGRSWRIHASNFWQAHKNAPEVYVKTVLDFADVSQNDLVLDLYSGSALFAAPLATLTNQVVAVESSIDAVRNARRSCSDLANLDLLTATVEDFLANNDEFFDVVVLDPPRAGAGEATISEIAKITKRRIIYVACEPAALARDTAQLASVGWELVDLRAFDAFPMTAHFECIALFKRSSTM